MHTWYKQKRLASRLGLFVGLLVVVLGVGPGVEPAHAAQTYYWTVVNSSNQRWQNNALHVTQRYWYLWNPLTGPEKVTDIPNNTTNRSIALAFQGVGSLVYPSCAKVRLRFYPNYPYGKPYYPDNGNWRTVCEGVRGVSSTITMATNVKQGTRYRIDAYSTKPGGHSQSRTDLQPRYSVGD